MTNRVEKGLDAHSAHKYPGRSSVPSRGHPIPDSRSLSLAPSAPSPRAVVRRAVTVRLYFSDAAVESDVIAVA